MQILISHDSAIALEHIIRRVYNCDRGGVGGLAEADELEYDPLCAAYIVLAPLYLRGEDLSDVDSFLQEYMGIYHYSEGEISKETTNKYIEDLRSLEAKYYRRAQD